MIISLPLPFNVSPWFAQGDIIQVPHQSIRGIVIPIMNHANFYNWHATTSRISIHRSTFYQGTSLCTPSIQNPTPSNITPSATNAFFPYSRVKHHPLSVAATAVLSLHCRSHSRRLIFRTIPFASHTSKYKFSSFAFLVPKNLSLLSPLQFLLPTYSSATAAAAATPPSN